MDTETEGFLDKIPEFIAAYNEIMASGAFLTKFESNAGDTTYKKVIVNFSVRIEAFFPGKPLHRESLIRPAFPDPKVLIEALRAVIENKRARVKWSNLEIKSAPNLGRKGQQKPIYLSVQLLPKS